MPYYVISIILNVPESLSATEQSTVSWSVVSSTTLLPVSISSDEPTGMGASLTSMLVPFAVLFVTALLAVSLTSLTVVVT